MIRTEMLCVVVWSISATPHLLWNYFNGNNLKLKQCMWVICVLLIFISQPVMSFEFVGCLVYSYRTSKIRANGLSINAGQVLYIILEWAWRRIASSDHLIPEIFHTNCTNILLCKIKWWHFRDAWYKNWLSIWLTSVFDLLQNSCHLQVLHRLGLIFAILPADHEVLPWSKINPAMICIWHRDEDLLIGHI